MVMNNISYNKSNIIKDLRRYKAHCQAYVYCRSNAPNGSIVTALFIGEVV
jgi:hypothetical protein